MNTTFRPPPPSEQATQTLRDLAVELEGFSALGALPAASPPSEVVLDAEPTVQDDEAEALAAVVAPSPPSRRSRALAWLLPWRRPR